MMQEADDEPRTQVVRTRLDSNLEMLGDARHHVVLLQRTQSDVTDSAAENRSERMRRRAFLRSTMSVYPDVRSAKLGIEREERLSELSRLSRLSRLPGSASTGTGSPASPHLAHS